jgi:molybdopterin converting factor small subunit
MVVVVLPGILAAQAGGRKRFEVDAATAEEALRALPVADLLFDERGELRPLVNVFVDGRDVREGGGLDASLADARELRVVGAVAGG